MLYKRTKFFDFNYRKFIGSWAWILHRLSGLALIFYLTLHIWIINTLTRGSEPFNEVMTFLGSPLFKFLEVGLWGVILYHAFNGIRVVIIDFAKGSLFHKKLFFILTTIAFILWVAGSVVILTHIH
ncbi:MAG: succinate dehydrogenase, cytochrome b556 subunit [Candidatus Aminicenantes bacterium]|nr:succinate dehydrogenase, cytochrome b556 subunit [Candidatus Aminicenantes bacterium]